MPEVVNVRFRSKGKAYFFDPAGTNPHIGDSLIVETAKGPEFGECVRGAHYVEETAIVPPLRPVLRIATDEDKAIAQANRAKEKTAFDFCQKKIEERGLEMKLVDVEYSFDSSKILFFFTSDGRVDFRELVKDLAGVFRTRIELRQIGVRDSAKLVGGLGICGRPFCCSTFLEDFQPVSIKMAKTQSLSLNPTKISGTCGRLMCCLKYEQDAYEHLLKTVPKVDTEVDTPDGKGTVKEVNLLRRTVKVKLAEENISELRAYPARELGFTIGGVYKEPEPPEEVFEPVPEPSTRFNFGRYDATPGLFNDKPAEQPEEEKPEHSEREREGGRSRHRGGHRHKNKKNQNDKPAAEKQEKPEQPKAEKPEQPKQERQEKQGGRNRNKQRHNKPQQDKPAQAEKPTQPKAEKPEQPKQERQEKQGGQHRSRRHRGGGGNKPQQEKPAQTQAQQSKPQQSVMDEKAKARAAAVAEAVAQAKPGGSKRNNHHYRRHRGGGGKPSGENKE